MASSISVAYAIDCHDGDLGISESNEPGRPVARVTFTCFSADHYQLCKDLYGTSIAAGTSIIRAYPFQYPPSPNLICTAIEDVQFFGKFVQIPGLPLPWVWRDHCRVRARFELPAWANNTNDPSGIPYTTTNFEGSVDVITTPWSTYTFPSGAPTETPLGVQVPKMAITMLRHMMPYPPFAVCFPLLGKVNLYTFTLVGPSPLVCAAGTLLFAGFACTPAADPVGNLYYDVQYALLYRNRPWNQFLSPSPSEGWAIPVDGSSNPVFQSADFSVIP